MKGAYSFVFPLSVPVQAYQLLRSLCHISPSCQQLCEAWWMSGSAYDTVSNRDATAGSGSSRMPRRQRMS